MDHLLRRVAAAEALDHGHLQPAHGASDRGGIGALPVFAERLEPGEQRFDLIGIFGEVRTPGFGHGEALLGAFRTLFLDKAHLVEQGDRWIDDAGAGRVGAAGHRLDLADQIIAMARFVGDQLEEDEPQFAAVEHAPAASAAAPATMLTIVQPFGPVKKSLNVQGWVEAVLHARMMMAATAAVREAKHDKVPCVILNTIKIYLSARESRCFA